MKELSYSASNLSNLENLVLLNSPIHKFNSGSKMSVTLLYIICVVSYAKYEISPLIALFAYPCILLPLSQIPFKTILPRIGVALPFTLFAGISNIIFERNTAILMFGINISYGVISFFSIILKTVLCVTAVLILIATTGISDICNTLIQIRVPKIFVMQFLMIYRYISLIISEFSTMSSAYSLRAGTKAIKFKDIGGFLGQYLLRVISKAERIFSAMKCRGFDGEFKNTKNKRAPFAEIIITLIICAILVAARMMRI